MFSKILIGKSSPVASEVPGEVTDGAPNSTPIKWSWSSLIFPAQQLCESPARNNI
mgnify:CR=1 FL=1